MRKIIFIVLSAVGFILSGCQSYGNQLPQSGYAHIYDQTADVYLQQAAQSNPPAKQDFQLQAIGRLLQDKQISQAQQLLQQLDNTSLTLAQINQKSLLKAQLYLLQNQPELALNTLNTIPDVSTLATEVQIAYYQLLAAADAQMGNPIASAEDLMQLAPLLPNTAQANNTSSIWANLQKASADDLNAQLHLTQDSTQRGWLDLAYLTKNYQGDKTLLANELENWQTEYPQHPAQSLATEQLGQLNPVSSQAAPLSGNQVGILLPDDNHLTYANNAVRSGIMAAYYTSAYAATQNLQTYSTYTNAVSGGAAWVLGPLDKNAVSNLARTNLSTPTLALNFTDSTPESNKLYQFALSPQDEATQVAEKAHQQGYSHALIIAPATPWGQDVVYAFKQSWQNAGGSVSGEFDYTNQKSLDPGIKGLLRIQAGGKNGTLVHRQDADVIFLVADPVTARQIKPLLQFYYAGDLPVYATSMVYAGKPNATLDRDLDGITFCDIPFVLENNAAIAKAKQQMQQLMPKASAQAYRLFAFGYDAYNLLPQLTKLGSSPGQGYQGLTGTLYLSANQQIKRQLSWASFKNGKPVELS